MNEWVVSKWHIRPVSSFYLSLTLCSFHLSFWITIDIYYLVSVEWLTDCLTCSEFVRLLHEDNLLYLWWYSIRWLYFLSRAWKYRSLHSHIFIPLSTSQLLQNSCKTKQIKVWRYQQDNQKSSIEGQQFNDKK